MRVDLKLANPNSRGEAIDVSQALVDTGATWTTVPRALADQLHLDIVGQTRVRTATGPQSLDHSYAWIRIQGKDLVSFVLVSDTYPGVLIGVTTLEGMGFAVDPGSQSLIDAELLLL